MPLPSFLRAALLGGAILALPLALSGCGDDLESHTAVQDCNGTRYIAPDRDISRRSGGDDEHASCVLRNGVMPQPQEFD